MDQALHFNANAASTAWMNPLFSTASIEDSLREHHAAMLRFAKRKVRDESLAEEAVQEAMLAAWQNADKFSGQSSLKTWMLGILHHKIQDVFRKESKYVSMDSDVDSDMADVDRVADVMKQGEASWGLTSQGQEAPDPFYALAQTDLRRAVSAEIERLPKSLRDVFERQIIDEQSTEEICEELGISTANAWVRVHRARKQLSSRLQPHLQSYLS